MAGLQSNGTLQRTWETTQISAFTKWCNAKLSSRNLQIENCCEDFGSGVSLIELLEIVSGNGIGGRWHHNPKQKIQMIENCNLAVSYIQNQMAIKLVGIGGTDIYDKSVKLTLGMLWSVISKSHVDAIMEGAKTSGQSSKDALLAWCKENTAGYDGVKIDDFGPSWSSGLGFCALLNKFVPASLDYNALDKGDVRGNITEAFNTMKQLGLAVYLDVGDLADVEKPDEKAVITQAAELYRFLTDLSLMSEAQTRLALTQTIMEKIAQMVEESEGSVHESLEKMRNGVAPLVEEKHMRFCPLCEQLFTALCELYDMMGKKDGDGTDVDGKMAELTAMIDALKKTIAEMEGKEKAAALQYEGQIALRDDEINRLKGDAENRRNNDNDKNDQIAKLTEELEKARRELDETKRELVMTKQELGDHNQVVSSLTVELDLMKAKVSENEVKTTDTKLEKKLVAREHFIEGMKLQYGHGVFKNEILALVSYRRAADMEDPDGYFSVGRCLERGDGTNKSTALAVRQYECAVALGHYSAMNNLGALKLSGDGCTQSDTEAADLFRNAASGGITAAQCNYGILLRTGRGVTEDKVDALRYFKQAADAGYPRALNNVAVMYDSGTGCSRDAREALRLFEAAVAADHSVAAFNLGTYAKDANAAAPFWKKAADAGVPEGLNNYGVALVNGDGVPRNEKKGVGAVKMAADKKVPDAICNYGIALFRGMGDMQNVRGAMKLFKISSDMDSAFGMANFAVHLAQGVHVKQNNQEAARLMRGAADKGEPIAQYNYAVMLLFGIGVAVCSSEAMRYLKYANNAGVTETHELLDQLK